MFNLKEFIVKNIVNGIKNGTFSKEYGNIMAVNYLVKGILSEEDVANIDAQISAWEAEQAAKEEKVEPPTEEMEPETEQNETEITEAEPENIEDEMEIEETETAE